jgi:hypothetical protein
MRSEEARVFTKIIPHRPCFRPIKVLRRSIRSKLRDRTRRMDRPSGTENLPRTRKETPRLF